MNGYEQAVAQFRLQKSEKALLKQVEKRKQAEDALRKSERRLEIKNRIANILLTVPDEDMYAEILQAVLEVTESRYGLFEYIDENNAWICHFISGDVSDRRRISEKNIRFPSAAWRGVWGKAMDEKKTLYSNEPFSAPEGHIPLLRALDAPLIHHGELIGNLFIGNKDTDYEEHDKQLIENLAEYIAPVLHARLQRDKEEREKKKFEAQLRHTQKMEAIGTLAGGIAHDFNNILSAILGYTELALEDIEKGAVIEKFLQEIYKAGKRAKDLVKQILTFARRTESEFKPIQLDAIAKEVLKLLRSSLPATIEIRPAIESNSLIMGDPTQIHQLFMNLCTNAAQTMEETGGVLKVGLADVTLDSLSPQVSDGLKIGDYVIITVADTGAGIAPDIIDSIFEPYFTTKEPGEGTGMGLAMVHGIVESCNGKITVSSELGKGTVFEICLPVSKKRATHQPYKTENLPSGSEHILFVDDEIPSPKSAVCFWSNRAIR